MEGAGEKGSFEYLISIFVVRLTRAATSPYIYSLLDEWIFKQKSMDVLMRLENFFLSYVLTDITFMFCCCMLIRWTDDCGVCGLEIILLSSILVHQIRFHRRRQCKLINMLF